MSLEEFLSEWNNDSPFVHVQTSGSTGAPKLMQVEKQRMLNSARITCDFLGLLPGNTALLCMSLDYIAGKMMVVRALERHLKLMTIAPSGHPLSGLMEDIDFAAMVPMQVYNSLQVPEECERLMQIRHLIIGGGAIDKKMQEELRSFPNAVWSTYGMTETLSHIALRRISGPEATDWYTPLAGVKIGLTENHCLTISAPHLTQSTLITNDIAKIDSNGKFKILGRADNVINSGGVKIQIEEVERRLNDLGIDNVAIGSCADEKFGEAVVLLNASDVSDSTLNQAISQLPKYWQPKRIIKVDAIPLTENGKIARQKVKEIVADNI